MYNCVAMILWLAAAALGFLAWEAYAESPAEEEGREPEELRPHRNDAPDPIIHHEVTATGDAPVAWIYT